MRGHELFLRDHGDGEPVLLVHGVPASSFLYRKMLPLLAAAGLRALAFDLPGLGLSAKPRGIRYDWHALAGWMGDLVAALELPPVHLVIHDIGGPIALEWAIRNPGRVRSLTILNTMLDLQGFRKPFPMSLFAVPLLGRVVFSAVTARSLAAGMRSSGVLDSSAIDLEVARSYLWLLRHHGGREAFLAIMAGFDQSPEHQAFLVEGARALKVPMQIVWGRYDSALPRAQRDFIASNLAIEQVHLLDARHFLQEDQAEACGERIVEFTSATR